MVGPTQAYIVGQSGAPDVTKGHCDCDAHSSSVKWIRLIMMSWESMG